MHCWIFRSDDVALELCDLMVGRKYRECHHFNIRMQKCHKYSWKIENFSF